MSLLHTILVILAVSSVAIADILIKKAALGSMRNALMSPLMLGAFVLYLFQILFFTYLFVHNAKLTHIGIMQTVFYALIVILAGVFLFGEMLTPIKITGITLALIGVILMNF